MDSKHQAEPATIQAIRQDLTRALSSNPLLPSISDADIQRFYRATSGQYKLTVDRLVATYTWRNTEKPAEKICKACAQHTNSHYHHAVGHDKQGRPVLFSSYMMVEDAGAAGCTEHMLVEFERATRLMGPGVESWVWIMDFKGFGRRVNDLNPALPRNFLDLSQTHYPERLGQLWVIDAPSIMTPLWNMLKPFIDPVTHAKFKFLPYDIPKTAPMSEIMSAAPAAALPRAPHDPAADTEQTAPAPSSVSASKLLAELHALADAELVKWLVQELRNVRTWDKANRKGDADPLRRPSYDVGALRQAVTTGELTLLPRCADGHCHYGTVSLLMDLASKPAILG